MKRKDFSNLKIEVQKKKNSYFEHENFIAGTAPFLRGINSFLKKNIDSIQNKSLSRLKLDISNSKLDIKINELLEVDSILLANSKNQTSEVQIAELLYYTHSLFSKFKNENIEINAIASKISFIWSTNQLFIHEIAKIRGTRMLWAKMVNSFQPRNLKSLALNIYIENTNDISSILTATTDTKNLQKNELKENFNPKTIDPWAGSFIVEKHTEEFTLKTWKIFLSLLNNKQS